MRPSNWECPMTRPLWTEPIRKLPAADPLAKLVKCKSDACEMWTKARRSVPGIEHSRPHSGSTLMTRTDSTNVPIGKICSTGAEASGSSFVADGTALSGDKGAFRTSSLTMWGRALRANLVGESPSGGVVHRMRALSDSPTLYVCDDGGRRWNESMLPVKYVRKRTLRPEWVTAVTVTLTRAPGSRAVILGGFDTCGEESTSARGNSAKQSLCTSA